MDVKTTIDGRHRHHGRFYGLEPMPSDRPLAIVMGNCQAESLRLFLGESVDAVRIPPVHELVGSDLPYLSTLLERVSLLVAQPIRDNYHGLPVGTRQLIARLRPHARHVIVPVVRFAGLYPAQAIIRSPRDASLQPPVVPYHDLRVLAEAAGVSDGAGGWPDAFSADGIRAVAALSLAELRTRETAYGTIIASDLVSAPDFASMRTINHPGNPVWEALASRIHDVAGIVGPLGDPGRPVLNSVHAPREEAVIEAWGLADQPVDAWRIEGVEISTAEVREAHLAWYAQHPEIVEAGLVRHADTLHALRLV